MLVLSKARGEITISEHIIVSSTFEGQIQKMAEISHHSR
jgi:hypothetical protein